MRVTGFLLAAVWAVPHASGYYNDDNTMDLYERGLDEYQDLHEDLYARDFEDDMDDIYPRDATKLDERESEYSVSMKLIPTTSL